MDQYGIFTDEYVKSEIATAHRWMQTPGHSRAEWDGFINGLMIMYLNCSEAMSISVQVAIELAERRLLYNALAGRL